jgi:glucose-6-phosphate 1-dehydrogenase
MQPTILVIFGITGDLAKRYILPAIPEIAAAKKLPEHFRIVGVSRRDITTKDLLNSLTDLDPTAKAYLTDHLEMFTMSLDDSNEYLRLKRHLDAIEQELQFGPEKQRLFYLSVPPQFSQPIVKHMGEAGLATEHNAKLLLEKPFGTDYESAKDFIGYVQYYFSEDQVYRIDHYLAKEMAQNLLIFRNSNALFKRTWNNQFIERIEIIASESIGIEGRAAFYEQTGALRDIVQSHLMQLAALTIMDLPGVDDTSLQAQRLQALRQISTPSPQTLHETVVRGQYEGYDAEVQNPGTLTETFASLTLTSADPNWQGVPITLTTGKALDRKVTEIRIHYKQENQSEANELVLRIQPDAGIQICLWIKQPGYEKQLERAPLNFTYNDYFTDLPDAYEQVLVDAIRSDHSLFASSDEVLESWRILAPIQHAWAMQTNDIVRYPQGTTAEEIISQTLRRQRAQ